MIELSFYHGKCSIGDEKQYCYRGRQWRIWNINFSISYEFVCNSRSRNIILSQSVKYEHVRILFIKKYVLCFSLIQHGQLLPNHLHLPSWKSCNIGSSNSHLQLTKMWHWILLHRLRLATVKHEHIEVKTGFIQSCSCCSRWCMRFVRRNQKISDLFVQQNAELIYRMKRFECLFHSISTKKTREIFSFVNVNWHHSTAKWNLKFHVCTIMLMCDPYTLKARAISMPNANLMCDVIKGLHLEDQQDFIFVPQVDVIHFLGCFNLKQDSSLWRERRDKLKWKHWIETKLKDS